VKEGTNPKGTSVHLEARGNERLLEKAYYEQTLSYLLLGLFHSWHNACFRARLFGRDIDWEVNKMKLKTLTIMVIAGCMTWCGFAQAETITVLPFKGESVHPQIKQAAKDALGIFLAKNGLDIVENTLKTAAKNREAAEAAVKATKATSYVEGRITRLGRQAIVQVQKFRVGNASAVFSDDMTAGSPEDLHAVMQRLAKGIATGQKSAANEDINTVTRREQKSLRRRTANQYFGLTLGGQVAAAHNTGFMPGFGFAWLFDNRNVLFGADLRFAGIGTNSTSWELALAGYYPFSDTDTTPYLGGGLALSGLSTVTESTCPADGPCYEDLAGEDESGMSFFVSGGVLIGRTSTVSIRPEIGYFMGTYSLDGKVVHGARFGLTLGF